MHTSLLPYLIAMMERRGKENSSRIGRLRVEDGDGIFSRCCPHKLQAHNGHAGLCGQGYWQETESSMEHTSRKWPLRVYLARP